MPMKKGAELWVKQAASGGQCRGAIDGGGWMNKADRHPGPDGLGCHVGFSVNWFLACVLGEGGPESNVCSGQHSHNSYLLSLIWPWLFCALAPVGLPTPRVM